MRCVEESILSPHRGKWVVVDRAWTTVLGATFDAAECAAIARRNRSKGPLTVYKVPAVGEGAERRPF